MSVALLDSFPPLPTELVREIVELSAKDHRCVALALLRVSAFMQQWIEPLVYETVILSTSKQVGRFFFESLIPAPGLAAMYYI